MIDFLFLASVLCEEKAEEKTEEPSDVTNEDIPKVDSDPGKSRDGSKTSDESLEREEEAIKIDGLSVAQMKELREKSEKHAFQAEVNRMMKLIINSLYKNKEVRTVLKSPFNERSLFIAEIAQSQSTLLVKSVYRI